MVADGDDHPLDVPDEGGLHDPLGEEPGEEYERPVFPLDLFGVGEVLAKTAARIRSGTRLTRYWAG